MRLRAVIMPCIVVAALGGCVEREMTITTDPPGALVFVSDKEIGRSPVSQRFLWYGDYDIILRLKGYKTLKTHANLRPPIYEIPPLDLLSAIAPWTYYDRRYLHFEMEKLVIPGDDELIRRAKALRARNDETVEK
ncbi:MAG: PEGA domain-containing protein [Planctomycetes bacterium]|nr:PEGA domain-containing protein [Planctomycetota bacterium]